MKNLKYATSLVLGLLAVTACAPAPVGTSSATVTGTMEVPKETNPAIAMAPLSPVQFAKSLVIGFPAWAATLDSSVTAQFKATIDGRATPCTWGTPTVSASGDTRVAFALNGYSTSNNTEVMFTSPSGSIKMATFVQRIDQNANTAIKTEVSARSTGALLIARAMAASGGKSIKSYTEADFTNVYNSPRTVEVETSLRAALSAANNKGTDLWTLPAVTQATLSVATALGVSLGLGGKVTVGTGVTAGL